MSSPAITVHYVATGLPASGTEVAMSSKDARPGVPSGSEPIFTQSMADCMAIGTFDHGNHNNRTLTHLWGRCASNSYYQTLAETISPNTTVILACGSIGTRFYFENYEMPNVRVLLESFMTKAKKPIDQLQWLTLYTEDTAQGLVKGSLVLQADGSYGRIKM
ncbi:hypothetical protein C8A00DRAFT_34811 [Chaetomidium leptoderma]|uniref:Uncharacterized protein n=1 Tax=Chaetomidium leptoderma TaxID=669021 RepID=A0AAN6ZUL2_9PEZI|nr:hypothetical protein C8A00DRAFT_34811 [Chaetomidium leptoderma]